MTDQNHFQSPKNRAVDFCFLSKFPTAASALVQVIQSIPVQGQLQRIYDKSSKGIYKTAPPTQHPESEPSQKMGNFQKYLLQHQNIFYISQKTNVKIVGHLHFRYNHRQFESIKGRVSKNKLCSLTPMRQVFYNANFKQKDLQKLK